MPGRILADEHALENLDGDVELLQSVRQVFVESASDISKELLRENVRGKSETFLRAVHSLKSSAGSIGAEKLSALAKNLEQMMKEGNYAEVEPLVPELNELFKITLVEIEKNLAQ